MAATTQQNYPDNFNPFSDDVLDDTLPDFSGSTLVLEDSRLTLRKATEETNVDTEEDRRPRTSLEPATESTPVLQQPRREDIRRPIPVYTVGWSSTANPQFVAITGLDFLTGVHQVLLQQTVTSLTSSSNVAKRYTIKIPNSETLYSTVENSSDLQRLCCGSQRSFSMSLLDQTHQEAATFARSMGLICGWFPCLLQELRVYTPEHLYLGKIGQDLSFSDTSFTVKDRDGQDLFRIFAPNAWAWSMPLEGEFTIAGGSGGGRLGTIVRQWNAILGDYNLVLTFPASGTPDNHKILLIGAALLISAQRVEHLKTPCTVQLSSSHLLELINAATGSRLLYKPKEELRSCC